MLARGKRICAIVAIALTFALPVLSQESEHHVVTTEILEELQALREDLDSFLVPANIFGRWEPKAACTYDGDIPLQFLRPPTYVFIEQHGNAFVGYIEEKGKGSVSIFEGTIRGNHLDYHRVIHTGDLRIAANPDPSELFPTDPEWMWLTGVAMGVGTITNYDVEDLNGRPLLTYDGDPLGPNLDRIGAITSIPSTIHITEGIEISRSRSKFDPDIFVHTTEIERFVVACDLEWHRISPATPDVLD